MKKNLIIKINIFFLLLLVYLFISLTQTIITTNNNKGNLMYKISLQDESKVEDMNTYIYNNIEKMKELTLWSYPYLYTNDEKVINKFSIKVDENITNPILINEMVFYAENYSIGDPYLYNGEVYSILGTASMNIIPMNSLPKHKFIELPEINIMTNTKNMNQIKERFKENNFNITYEEMYIGGDGSYDITSLGVITSYIKSNILLIVVVLLSSFLINISMRGERVKLKKILRLHGICARRCFLIYLKKYFKLWAVSFIIFIMFVLILNYLSIYYIFLSGIEIEIVSLILTLLVSNITIFLLSIINTLAYVRGRIDE